MYKLLGAERYLIKVISQYNVQGGVDNISLFLIMNMSNKNYAMGHCFSSRDLFMNFPVEKLNMTTEQCKQTYSDGSKRDLAASIFDKSVQMVVNDIIDNNVHFKLPGLGRTQAYIYMKRTQGKGALQSYF